MVVAPGTSWIEGVLCAADFSRLWAADNFSPPLWYVKLDGCILTSSLETMGQLGHINDSFQNSMFSKLNLETYGFRGVKHFQVLFAFSAQPAISAFISGRSSE